jgi:hypothetical protein
MTMNTTTTDGESNIEHPAADLDTIVVDPDDVVEAMQRNKRDEDEQRSHDLRVTPPLEGERKAEPYVSEAHARYPPEMSQTPLHIGPEAFIVGHGAGTRHPDFRNEWCYPDYGTEQHRFRDEIGAWDDDGTVRPLTDDEEDGWDDWWDTVVEMWENRVRNALKKTEELTLTSQHPDIENTTVSVRIED